MSTKRPMYDLSSTFHKRIVASLGLSKLQYLISQDGDDLYFEHSQELCVVIGKGSAVSCPLFKARECGLASVVLIFEIIAGIAPIRERVESYVLNAFKKISSKPINQLASFAELKINSLDIVELIMHLEDDFEVELPDSVVKQTGTIMDLINGVIVELLELRMWSHTNSPC